MTLSLLPALLSSVAVAQFGAHEHGRAELSLVVEGGEAQVRLITDLGSVLGFERPPESDAERAAVGAAEAALNAAGRIFTLGPARAGCVLSGATIEMPFGEHDAGGDGGGGDAAHLDVTATYRLDCARPERLRSVRVDAFEAFPGIETVDVVVLSARVQTGGTVDASDRTFSFR